MLIYHDEVNIDSGAHGYSADEPGRPGGALLCRSETRIRAGWRFIDGLFFYGVANRTTPVGDFQQIRTGNEVVPSLARLSRNSGFKRLDGPHRNGLWICRVNSTLENLQDVLTNMVFIGLYKRGEGSDYKQGLLLFL